VAKDAGKGGICVDGVTVFDDDGSEATARKSVVGSVGNSALEKITADVEDERSGSSVKSVSGDRLNKGTSEMFMSKDSTTKTCYRT
jgi:hypothetical protein